MLKAIPVEKINEIAALANEARGAQDLLLNKMQVEDRSEDAGLVVGWSSGLSYPDDAGEPRPGARPPLFPNDDGATIVIHESLDDSKTDPAGSPGAPIACGVIELQAAE